jgi:hypothetical protein
MNHCLAAVCDPPVWQVVVRKDIVGAVDASSLLKQNPRLLKCY